MLHHLTLWVPDIERAAPAWQWLLGELGYTADQRSAATVLIFRHAGSASLVLEQSSDMVPGMLHSRFRPGLNHIAFTLDSLAVLRRVLDGAARHGWSPLRGERHPITGGADVAYLEDRDGFEVELVAPLG